MYLHVSIFMYLLVMAYTYILLVFIQPRRYKFGLCPPIASTSNLVHLLDIRQGGGTKYSIMLCPNGDGQEGVEMGPKEPWMVSSPWEPPQLLNCPTSLLSRHTRLITALWH